MAKYYLTNKAVEDLADIWDYTYHEWSENQADKYYLSLLGHCQEIANYPNLGKKYDIVASNLLGYRANKHIVFYQIISSSEIEIVRILHGMMDLKNIL